MGTTMTSYRVYNRSKNVDKYCASLVKRGAKLISDDGIYSSVYSHPTKKNTVIKISEFSYGCPDGWFHYALFLIKNKIKSPHAPKIYTLSKYKNMYVATMEQLTPYAKNKKDFRSDFMFIDWNLNPGQKCNKKTTTDKLRRLKHFINMLNAYKPFEKLGVDIHEGNTMIRRKVLVLTDPFCGEMRPPS